ncbi:MAG: HDIG domain-containing metalloprotein, partial [Byssovorax sp.]
MEQSPVQGPSPGPDAQRAMDALDWAVVQAERGGEIAAEEAIKAAPVDFRAAATSYVDAMRVRLDRIVMSGDAEAGLDALLVTGALVAILPEVEAMVGFGDGEWRHKDVWKHTKQVVRQAVPKIEVRWGALLHDIGKIKTRSISDTGEVHFFGHAEVGARMFDKIDRRMPLFVKDQALKSSVRFLILHHLRASQYEASWTDSAVRRFTKEMGCGLDDVLNLSRADITTKRPEKKRKGLKQISDLAERVRVIAEQDAIVPPLPSGIGDDMMKAFGIPPSRRIGDLKKALEAAVDAGEVISHQDSAFYLAFLRANAER